MKDEIVEEVRRVRARIFEASGGTLDLLYARLKELEGLEARPTVSLPPKRPVGVDEAVAEGEGDRYGRAD